MKTHFSILLITSLAGFFFAGTAYTGNQEKMLIELKTNDFEIAETDIGELAVGEAKTIVTDSGKTIDVLRTIDGVEIYVDGQLLDLPKIHEANGQAIHEHVVIECTSNSGQEADSDCDHEMMFFSGDDVDVEVLGEDNVDRHVIVKRIHTECTGDQQGECAEEQVWVSDDATNVEFGDLHEAGDGTHKVMRIHKLHDGDANAETTVEKIIIINNDTEEEL